MSPTLESFALEHFERSNAIKIHNGIMFDFYPGQPHMMIWNYIYPAGRSTPEEVRHGWPSLIILITGSSLVGLGYCTIKASLAFAMTGPGFEFDLINWKVGPLSVKAKRVCLFRYGNQLVMKVNHVQFPLDQHRPPEELVKQWHSHLGGTILVKVIYSIGRAGSLAYISLASFPGHKGNLGLRLICFWDVFMMFPLGIGPRAHGPSLSHQFSDHWAMTTRQPPALLYIYCTGDTVTHLAGTQYICCQTH